LGGVRGKPAYRPGGVRHTGGASLAQAPVRNGGTWTPILRRPEPAGRERETPKRQKPQGAEYRGGDRGGVPRSSDETW
jgi:hypothetical protein